MLNSNMSSDAQLLINLSEKLCNFGIPGICCGILIMSNKEIAKKIIEGATTIKVSIENLETSYKIIETSTNKQLCVFDGKVWKFE